MGNGEGCTVLYCTVLTMEEELEISEMGDMFSKNICLASTEEDCCPLWPASSPLDRRESTCSPAVVMVIPRCSIQTKLWFTSKEGGLVSVLLP